MAKTTYTATLRRAGLQADGTIHTVEDLEKTAAEMQIPFGIYSGNVAVGRVTRVWIEGEELKAEITIDDESLPRPPASC